MALGLLTFSGTIDLNQFWPSNVTTKNSFDSDADTVKVKIDMSTILFTNAAGTKKKTTALNGAGFFHSTKKTDGTIVRKFKPVINSSNIVTMRLQGIDAPELHYMVGTPLYRQQMGDTSTIALHDFLQKQATGNSLACEVFTQVNEPNDVFDKYGRCVGDINIQAKSGKTIDINHWLVENGYAYPAFYNSMTAQETNTLVALGESAMKKKQNIWKYAFYKMAAMDRTLTHSKKDATYSARADKKKPVIFPKLFRRLWEFEIKNKKAFTAADYNAFLLTKKDDTCCLRTDFLNTGFPKHKPPLLAKFVLPTGVINFKPAEIVFKEGGTTLRNSAGNKVTKF